MNSRTLTEPSSQPGKIVGHRKMGDLLDPLVDTKEKARAWRRALPTAFIRKGVYRFRSHEEAQEWLEQQLTRR